MTETKTMLSKYYYLKTAEETIYTKDYWVIPNDGTIISCTRWDSVYTIKPYGDSCHVYVGRDVYHCDQFMDILNMLEEEGYTWEIKNVPCCREQHINGRWTKVKLNS